MSPIIDYLHHFGFLDWLHPTCKLSVQSLVRIFKASCHQRASSIILESQKPGQHTHSGSCTLQRHNIHNLSKSDSHGISACKFIIVQLRHSFQLFMLSNSYGATLASRVGGPFLRCSSSWKIQKLIGSLARKWWEIYCPKMMLNDGHTACWQICSSTWARTPCAPRKLKAGHHRPRG